MNLTLFDLDGTLIPVDSDHAFGGFMVDVGWVDGAVWGAKNDEFFAQYNAGTLDLPAYVDFATSAWRSRPLAEALAMRERFMVEVMKPALRPEAVALVEQHRAAGDLIALVTATNEFVTAPIAAAFGIEHLIAVQLERDPEGRYTGAIHGVPSFREGKIARVQDWLQGLGAQWHGFERVTFYSDSTNDLPLLERVSHPVATNPSPALAQIAAERGWPQFQLFA
ncbi:MULTISPECIES: HAD family phosphatase [unclassified Roseateles]|uniref:histidinol-phosphatase n=1 Tax=unclassified Roseateles TaxID=2626991 RepID=UPI000701BA3D|nr:MULTISPECIES: HAD family hydrolase [unclassified Roseateles]KQW43439.1 phosphoserine phosphatase [Pelomonas sp. Root405]KRA71177.1 phosphoserine phosphatase [Pelomonas sp. Root662]